MDMGPAMTTGDATEWPSTLRTQRLEIRHPREADRARFVELFGDPAFMVFAGTLTPAEAERRFDDMVARCAVIPFGKQPVLLAVTGEIVGYSGVGELLVAGRRRLEYGWRLIPEARGRGLATEATRAVLTAAAQLFTGEIVAVLSPRNNASRNVARKVGFRHWRTLDVEGALREVHRLELGELSAINPALLTRSPTES